jgi:hypothetical protein
VAIDVMYSIGECENQRFPVDQNLKHKPFVQFVNIKTKKPYCVTRSSTTRQTAMRSPPSRLTSRNVKMRRARSARSPRPTSTTSRRCQSASVARVPDARQSSQTRGLLRSPPLYLYAYRSVRCSKGMAP